ncbi:MAG TPA: hypothetical protein VHC44_02155 [Verrucomicrobiae bacterium]|nr:hypothetical protein [Verrucomicrobiae bacterium]
MQTPKQITPAFAPETRFEVETQILPVDRQNGLPEHSAFYASRRVIEIPEPRGISFSALND